MDLLVEKVTNNALALTNCAFVSRPTFTEFCAIAGYEPEGNTVQAFGALARVGACVFTLRCAAAWRAMRV